MHTYTVKLNKPKQLSRHLYKVRYLLDDVTLLQKSADVVGEQQSFKLGHSKFFPIFNVRGRIDLRCKNKKKPKMVVHKIRSLFKCRARDRIS